MAKISYINPYTDFAWSHLEPKAVKNTAEMDGRKKEKIEIAKEMKEAGEPKEKIMKYTGLTSREIDRL